MSLHVKTKLSEAWYAVPHFSDRGLVKRAGPALPNNATPEVRLRVAQLRARAYTVRARNTGSDLDALVGETYQKLAQKIASEIVEGVAVGKWSKPPDCGSGNRGFESRRPPPARSREEGGDR